MFEIYMRTRKSSSLSNKINGLSLRKRMPKTCKKLVHRRKGKRSSSRRRKDTRRKDTRRKNSRHKNSRHKNTRRKNSRHKNTRCNLRYEYGGLGSHGSQCPSIGSQCPSIGSCAEEVVVFVNGLDGTSIEIPVYFNFETGSTLLNKVHLAFNLNDSNIIKLYNASDGARIKPNVLLAIQGIHSQDEIDMVISPAMPPIPNCDIHSITQKWYKHNTRQAIVDQYGEIGDWNVSQVINMAGLFALKSEFNEDISDWDTRNVTTMRGMFFKARLFNQPLNSWDVSSVRDTRKMFYEAESFNQPLDNWELNSIRDMREMFYEASSFNQNLDEWRIGENVHPEIGGMFVGADSLEKLPEWYQ